jgi:hypothetical protein
MIPSKPKAMARSKSSSPTARESTTREALNEDQEAGAESDTPLPRRRATPTECCANIQERWFCPTHEKTCYNPIGEDGKELMHLTLSQSTITTWSLKCVSTGSQNVFFG